MDTPLAFTHFNEVINFIKLPPLGDTIFDYKIDSTIDGGSILKINTREFRNNVLQPAQKSQ